MPGTTGPMYTVNDIFCYAEVHDPRCNQTLQKTLENKNHEWEAILENKIAKLLETAQWQNYVPRKFVGKL